MNYWKNEASDLWENVSSNERWPIRIDPMTVTRSISSRASTPPFRPPTYTTILRTRTLVVRLDIHTESREIHESLYELLPFNRTELLHLDVPRDIMTSDPPIRYFQNILDKYHLVGLLVTPTHVPNGTGKIQKDASIIVLDLNIGTLSFQTTNNSCVTADHQSKKDEPGHKPRNTFEGAATLCIAKEIKIPSSWEVGNKEKIDSEYLTLFNPFFLPYAN